MMPISACDKNPPELRHSNQWNPDYTKKQRRLLNRVRKGVKYFLPAPSPEGVRRPSLPRVSSLALWRHCEKSIFSPAPGFVGGGRFIYRFPVRPKRQEIGLDQSIV